MKKTIIVLVMVALCATVFASFQTGINVMLGAPLSSVYSSVKEKDYSVVKELENSEITAKLCLDFLSLDFGFEGGIVFQNETVAPIFKAYGGLKATVLGFLKLGGGAGCRFAFIENGSYEKELYWRVSGGMEIGDFSLEGIATMPVELSNGFRNTFNFGSHANAVRLGVGFGIKLK
jgi:hypothetical protein